MNKHYKISVITAVLNNVTYIENAIQSVLKQDYTNYEHIIVDGGSTDGTIEILKKYKHLKWISEPDKGQSDAMNKGFKISTGQVIVYLNADDYINPGAFSSVIPYFLNGAKFVVGKIKVINETDNFWINDAKTKHEEILRHWQPEAFCVNPVGYYYQREVQESVKGFNVSNHYTMDYEFLLEASKKFTFEKIKEDIILGVFRYFEATKTAHFMKSTLMFNYKKRTYVEKFLQNMPKEYIQSYRNDRDQYFRKKRIEFYKKKTDFFSKLIIKFDSFRKNSN